MVVQIYEKLSQVVYKAHRGYVEGCNTGTWQVSSSPTLVPDVHALDKLVP